jgi:NitT/TauT family transport system ATP-binding protein
MIEITDLSKSFGEIEALHEASFTVAEGEFVALIGPSGCGKSTLLNMVSGLMQPTSGTIRYDGVVVEEINTRVGYMTQNETLLPWRSVADNISVPLEIRGMPKAARRSAIDQIIEMVGLTGFAAHYPSQLSGGMRKRVQLARTLVYEPETLLMDEPFGSLDPLLKLVVQEELLRIWEHSRKTVLYVTHDLGEAISLADRVIVFTRRPATISAIFTIDLPRPRDIGVLRGTPAFATLYEHLWEALRGEVVV